MTYQVGWGRDVGAATAATVAELNAILDGIQVAPDEMPYGVSIVLPDGSDFPVMLEICVGHPTRSFAYHVDADGTSAWGYQPEVPAGPEFAFDYGGVATDAWSERTRLTPEAAREAAREFVAGGGRRPANLAWDTDE
jgi:hypothetical protein